MKKNNGITDFLYTPAFWRVLSYSLTLAVFTVIIVDFITANGFLKLLVPLLLIYTATLVIYATEKEFERWNQVYKKDKHPGEWFVISWTILIALLIFLDIYIDTLYQIPGAIIETYVFVVTLLILTKKSKRIYKRRGNRLSSLL